MIAEGRSSSDGTTPLDPDEASDLIPQHIETRNELNEWEQANIAAAERWLGRRREPTTVLRVDFARELHRRMFGTTWRWAGRFRTTEKTIGVSPFQVPEALLNLVENTNAQVRDGTLSPDEIALRFHHALVGIHPFPNGNGRHARAMTDALLLAMGVPRFSWGSATLDAAGDVRTRYIGALRAADAGDFAPLRSFVRS